jgi:hypothetical protein
MQRSEVCVAATRALIEKSAVMRAGSSASIERVTPPRDGAKTKNSRQLGSEKGITASCPHGSQLHLPSFALLNAFFLFRISDQLTCM